MKTQLESPEETMTVGEEARRRIEAEIAQKRQQADEERVAAQTVEGR